MSVTIINKQCSQHVIIMTVPYRGTISRCIRLVKPISADRSGLPDRLAAGYTKPGKKLVNRAKLHDRA
jgi:hypothetical protein